VWGGQPLKAGTFWMVEQIPGTIQSVSETETGTDTRMSVWNGQPLKAGTFWMVEQIPGTIQSV
jgi:hypothetical protein